MTKLAAIDVGSNAMRMLIGSVEAEDPPKVIDSIREPVRLGKDVFTQGTISEETTERAVEAFIRFRRLLYKHEIKHFRAVATSALREAFNRDIFIDRISQASDIDIQVIGGEEEARLIHLAVSRAIGLNNKLALLVDVGGGSVEITLVADGKIVVTESFNMGTVRLLQKLEQKKEGERQFNQLVREYVDATRKRIKKEIGNQKIDLCIGTGGNVETLGDLRKDFFGKENGVVTRGELETLAQRLQEMPLEERILQLRMRPDRADVIIPASIVLQRVVKLAGVDELLIPRVGLKDGVLIDIAEELLNHKKISMPDQVRSSALQVGRKYFFDEQHGTLVARFALQLFDDLKVLHHLNDDSRLLLETSALLHDVGHFVNAIGHHKHSFYLLNATPVMGLNDKQRAIVANVARYHRKSAPTIRHEGYKNLSSRERVVVTKLSAILRMAEALDTEHASRVSKLGVEYNKPQLVFKLEGDGDLLLEKWALLKRAPFFEEVFSVKVSIGE